MGQVNIEIETDDSTARLKELDKGNSKGTGQQILNLLTRGISGCKPMSIRVSLGAVKASSFATFASVIATDVLTINGDDVTCVASGASTDEFNVGASDTLSAAACAAAINASATFNSLVEATSSGAVVTVRALKSGVAGNDITFASADATITADNATLENGSDGDVETLNFGKAAYTD